MTVSRIEIATFVPDNKTIARNVLRVAGNIDTYYECYTNGDGPYKEFFFAIGRDPDAVSPTSLSFTLFLTLALKAAVPPEMTRYPFYRRLGGPQGRSERESIPGASSP